MGEPDTTLGHVEFDPVKASDFIRNLSPEECEKLRNEFLERLPKGSSVDVSPIGIISVQFPLHISKPIVGEN